MKIICLGDSYTEGFLVENKSYTRFLEEAGFDIINLGINGSRTDSMLNRLNSYQKVDKVADLLIVFGGTNDFIQGYPVDFVFQKLKSIVDLSNARQKLLIIPPFVEEDEFYPVYGEINKKIQDLKDKIKDWGIGYIDADEIPGHYLDGVHLASDFHQNLARKIIEMIGGKNA